MAQDVNRHIINDDIGRPQFARAGQNIAAAAALLQTLPEPAIPEAQRTQREMATLLAQAAEIQVMISRWRVAQSSGQTNTARWVGNGNATSSRHTSVHQTPPTEGTGPKWSIHSGVGAAHDVCSTIDAR